MCVCVCTYKSKLSSYISHGYHTSKEDAGQPGSYVQEVRRCIPAYTNTEEKKVSVIHFFKCKDEFERGKLTGTLRCTPVAV